MAWIVNGVGTAIGQSFRFEAWFQLLPAIGGLANHYTTFNKIQRASVALRIRVFQAVEPAILIPTLRCLVTRNLERNVFTLVNGSR
jgi:hypothetical protein